jgi:hypothetical protein
MDALERLFRVATGLLGQVDRTLLQQGAPANHPVWALLREVGALPGEAIEALVEWRADSWLELRAGLAVERDRYERALELLRRPVSWEGFAGQAAGAQQGALTRATEEAADRLARTDLHLSEQEQWLSSSRDLVARALARVMSSTDAVTLVTGMDGTTAVVTSGPVGLDATVAARSAAEIGVTLLTALAECWRDAQLLEGQWTAEFAELATPLTIRAAALDVMPSPTVLRIDL